MLDLKTKVPSGLSVLVHLGILTASEARKASGANFSMDCPFCGADNAMGVALEEKVKLGRTIAPGMWNCFRCGESGNTASLLQKVYALAKAIPDKDIDYSTLIEERFDGLVPESLIKEYGIVPAIWSNHWWIPIFNEANILCNIYRYDLSLKAEGSPYAFIGCPGCSAGLFNVQTLYTTPPGNTLPKKEIDAIRNTYPVRVCYSPDTEILTPAGWKLLPEVMEEDLVAQYDPKTGSIDFVTPKNIIALEYTGPMVHLAGRWSDLLVTPDHRTLSRAGNTQAWVEKPAIKLSGGRQLPTAGVYHGSLDTGLSESQVRLLAAFSADGCIRSKGNLLEWGLKKSRKKDRLRELLVKSGIPFDEKIYPSNQGYSYFTVNRNNAPFFLENFPNKKPTWEILNWPENLKRAYLDEIQRWDGDSGVGCFRFFTSSVIEADIISALAATTGYSCTLSRHARGGEEYILTLLPKSERFLTNKPTILEGYSGKVFCLSVPSSWLLVRRNGCVMVSGNCEGHWDTIALDHILREAGVRQYCDVLGVPGANSWQAAWFRLIDKRPLELFFDNDPPKEINGKTIQPGWDGMQRVIKLAKASTEFKPSSIKVIEWKSL